MDHLVEILIVGLVVLLAAGYLARAALRKVKAGGCGGGCSCASKPTRAESSSTTGSVTPVSLTIGGRDVR